MFASRFSAESKPLIYEPFKPSPIMHVDHVLPLSVERERQLEVIPNKLDASDGS